MGLDPETKLMEGVKGKPVFEQVEFEDISKIDLLDEAIILNEDIAVLKTGRCETIITTTSPQDSDRFTQENENFLTNPNFMISTTDFERVMHLGQVLPVPLIPMALAIIALLLAVAFGHV